VLKFSLFFTYVILNVLVWLAPQLHIWEVTGTHPLGASVVWGCTNKRNG